MKYTNYTETVLEDGTFQIKVELPGVEKADVLPKREGNVIAIRIAKNDTRFSEKEYYAYFDRSADLTKAKFTLGSGVLTVTVPPKADQYQSFSVE